MARQDNQPKDQATDDVEAHVRLWQIDGPDEDDVEGHRLYQVDGPGTDAVQPRNDI